MYKAGRHSSAAVLTYRRSATLQGPCSMSTGCFLCAHIKAVSKLLTVDALSRVPFEAASVSHRTSKRSAPLLTDTSHIPLPNPTNLSSPKK